MTKMKQKTPLRANRAVSQEFGHPILRGQFNKDSIMAGGVVILPEHGVTFLEALRDITGMQEWAIMPKSPRAIPTDK